MKRTKFIFTHHRECAGIGGAEGVTEAQADAFDIFLFMF